MKTWISIVAAVWVLISMEVMADPPGAPPTARETELAAKVQLLEARLEACQAEVDELKAPPPSEDELMRKIDNLQQRINEAQ